MSEYTMPPDRSGEDDQGDILVLTPSPRLRAFYLLLLILAVWIGILPWVIIAAVTLPGELTLTLIVPILVVVVAVRWWIPRYWESIQFFFDDTRMVCSRGVWKKRSGVVHYTDILDIEVFCGLVCRHLGMAELRVFTSGGRTIRIPGVEEAERIREVLVKKIGIG